MSRREAAQRAGVHANTLAAWERKGLIKARRVRVKGREETRIPAAELERVLRNGDRRDEKPAVVESPPPRLRFRSRDERARAARVAAIRRADEALAHARRAEQALHNAGRREQAAYARAERERNGRAAAEGLVHDLEGRLHELRQELARTQRELASAQGELRAQETKHAKALAEVTKRAERLKAEAAQEAESARRLRADAEGYDDQVRAEINRQRDDLRDAVAELNRRAEDVERERTDVEALRRRYEDRDRFLSHRLDEQLAANAELAARVETMRIDLDSLRAALHAAEFRAQQALETARAEAAASVTEALLARGERPPVPDESNPPANDGGLAEPS